MTLGWRQVPVLLVVLLLSDTSEMQGITGAPNGRDRVIPRLNDRFKDEVGIMLSAPVAGLN